MWKSSSESERLSVPISALQHWQFCPRQCALIHVERLWAENRLTAEGRVLHERVEGGRAERRGRLRVLRSVALSSERHGLHGVADVVELRDGSPYPVEYKRGKPKAHRSDEVQLCAQVLCLEEAFGTEITEGALFYGQRRRRTTLVIDAELRALTIATAEAVREALTNGTVPTASYEPKRCDTCSLFDLCSPKRLSRPPKVLSWMQRAVTATGAPE